MSYLFRSPLYLWALTIYSQGEAEYEKIPGVCVPVLLWGRQGGEQRIQGSKHRKALSGIDASLLFSVGPLNLVSFKSILLQLTSLPKPHSGVGGQ